MAELREIFTRITEHYSMPIRVGSRCEASVYYRVEDLSTDDIKTCATYISDRIIKVSSSSYPSYLVTLKGSYTELGQILASELSPPGEILEVLSYDDVVSDELLKNKLKGSTVILVNDVITTARSCLEAHTRITLMGSTVLSWAALIDRTFGPGPVPVVAAFTGEPVTLLEGLP